IVTQLYELPTKFQRVVATNPGHGLKELVKILWPTKHFTSGRQHNIFTQNGKTGEKRLRGGGPAPIDAVVHNSRFRCQSR
ncbi:MAG: hypothetical protein DMG97_42305, partial [Acidobacteria bacterium]